MYIIEKKKCRISTVLPKNDLHQFVYNCKFTRGWWTFPPRPIKNYHFKSIHIGGARKFNF